MQERNSWCLVSRVLRTSSRWTLPTRSTSLSKCPCSRNQKKVGGMETNKPGKRALAFLRCIAASARLYNIALPCLALPCRVGVPCLVLSCLVLSCCVVSCRVVSCRVVSCRVVSCRVVSCRVLSCLANPSTNPNP